MTPTAAVAFPRVKKGQIQSDADNWFICNIPGCGKSFESRRELSTHRKEPHRIVCPQCGKIFSFMSNFRKHLSSHSTEKPYVCDFPGCSKAFKQASSLKNHRYKHEGRKPYECFCGVKFANRSNLNRHRRKLHGLNTKGAKLNISKEPPKGKSG